MKDRNDHKLLVRVLREQRLENKYGQSAFYRRNLDTFYYRDLDEFKGLPYQRTYLVVNLDSTYSA
jgi:hypothetical protein